MNATQDASNNAQKNFDKALLEYNDKQTELIFETRKRLFKLERTQNTDCKIFINYLSQTFGTLKRDVFHLGAGRKVYVSWERRYLGIGRCLGLPAQCRGTY